MIDEVDTDGLKVKSDSGEETTILAGTIDFLDFCTMVRKMNDAFSEADLKKSFSKFAEAPPADAKELIDRARTSIKVETKEEEKKWSKAFDGALSTTKVGGAMHSLGLEPTDMQLLKLQRGEPGQ